MARYKPGVKRDFELRIEHAPVGTSVRRKRTSKWIHATPREVLRMAAKAVRDGRGDILHATVHADMITLANCSYSIRPRKPTRRVERSFARCDVDALFKNAVGKKR